MSGLRAEVLARPPSIARRVVPLLPLLLLCIPFTVAAVQAFPIWDDGWLRLLIEEQGPDAIRVAFADRPANALLWWWLATFGQIWPVAVLAQALLWPLLGLLSAQLWSRFVPELRRYMWLVACVTVAPFATKVQMVTANIALASLLSVVLAYAALVLFAKYTAAADRAGRVSLAFGLALLASAAVLQEYALPVLLILFVLLGFDAVFVSDSARRIRALRAMLMAGLIISLAYGGHLLLADRTIRPSVQPLRVLDFGWRHYIRLPFRLAASVWWGVGGGFARSLSDIDVSTRADLFSVAYGAGVGVLLVYVSRPARGPAGPTEFSEGWKDVVPLGAGLLAGLVPMIAMGRIPWDPVDGMASRFGLPALPMAAALLVRIGIGLVRQRLWPIPVLLLGLAAGNTALMDARAAIRERQLITTFGAALVNHVRATPGLVVAVVPLPERAMGPQRPWELTARLTGEWPPELRRRFWAFRFGSGAELPYAEEATEVFGIREECRPVTELDVEVRHLVRQGPLERVLWVVRRPDGSVLVESYCLEYVSEAVLSVASRERGDSHQRR